MSRRTLLVTVAAASLALPAAAAAQQPDPLARYVAANGEGRAEVRAPERRTETTIAQAVRQARLAAIPRAVGDARARAAAAAAAAGLPLGAIVSVDESRFGPFGPYDYGRFGPGRYCGQVTRRVALPRRTGEPRRYRRVRTRECVVPELVTVNVAVTFATG